MSTPGHRDHDDDLAALAELAEAFADLVGALHAGDPPGLTPAGIIELSVRCMPRSQHAALLLADHGTVVSVADTDDLAVRIDRIRADVGEGPSLDVLDTNDLVVSGDLATDPRWPVFGPRVAAETGIRSIATYRLSLSPTHRAALTFHSDWPFAFDELATAMGAIFAAYCSLTLAHTALFDQPVGPRRAADVHREIGVAIGILMSTADHTPTSAYRTLHQASQDLRRSLPDTAHHVVTHRRLPAAPAPPVET